MEYADVRLERLSSTLAGWLAVGRWTLTLVLGGWLLLAHGCHGDEDHELFAGRLHVVVPLTGGSK